MRRPPARSGACVGARSNGWSPSPRGSTTRACWPPSRPERAACCCRDQATSQNLWRAIQAASDGDGSLPPDLLGRLLGQVSRIERHVLSPRGLTFSGLTEREARVLRLLADGHSTTEVGRRLFMAERTVKNVIHDVTSRFNLTNRTHAVAYALREGLI